MIFYVCFYLFFSFVNFNTAKQLIEIDPELISDELAVKIVFKYPTPVSLYRAYQECKSEDEKENLIVNNIVIDPLRDSFIDVHTFTNVLDSDLEDLCNFIEKLDNDGCQMDDVNKEVQESQNRLTLVSQMIYYNFCK